MLLYMVEVQALVLPGVVAEDLLTLIIFTTTDLFMAAEAMVADTAAVSNQGGIVPARPCARRVTTIMRDRGCAGRNATDFAAGYRIANPSVYSDFGLSLSKGNGLVPKGA